MPCCVCSNLDSTGNRSSKKHSCTSSSQQQPQSGRAHCFERFSSVEVLSVSEVGISVLDFDVVPVT